VRRMTWLRFTLAQLMALVLVLGFGFAALRDADHYWADATYTIAILSVSTALLGAIVRRGPTRVPWIGYAVFGWTYVLLDFLPSYTGSGFGFERVKRPTLMIMWAIGRLQPHINGSTHLFHYDQVSYSLGMILFGLVGSIVGRLIAVKPERPNP
jgi:hypothetical protein